MSFGGRGIVVDEDMDEDVSMGVSVSVGLAVSRTGTAEDVVWMPVLVLVVKDVAVGC